MGETLTLLQQLQAEIERLSAENHKLKQRSARKTSKTGLRKWRRMVYKAWQEIEPLRRIPAIEVMQKILINKSWAFYDIERAEWCVFDGLGPDQHRAAVSLIRAIQRGEKAAIHYRVMLARDFEGPAE